MKLLKKKKIFFVIKQTITNHFQLIHNANAIKFVCIYVKYISLIILTNLPLNLHTVPFHLAISLLSSKNLLPNQYLKYHWNQPWGCIELIHLLFSLNPSDVSHLTPYLLTLT